MGRAPCCDKANVKKGPWSPEEDAKLKEYIEKHGVGGNWIALPQKAGLRRCGKSCRLRWLNYLRPNIKHGEFSETEDAIICNLYATIGSRWSIIAAQLPGRTDNDIKNYWNTKLKKKLMTMAANNNISFTPHPSHHNKYRTNHHHFQLMQHPATSTGAFQLYPSSTSSSLLLSPEISSSSPCNNNSSISFYNTISGTAMTPTLNFPGFDQSSYLSSSSTSCSLSTTSVSTILQQTNAAVEKFQDHLDGYNNNNVHSFNPAAMHSNNNYLVFGNTPDQGSCSSSDESCSNNNRDHNNNNNDGSAAGAPNSSTTNTTTGSHEQQAINFLRWYSGSSNYPYNSNIGLIEQEEEEDQKAFLSSNGMNIMTVPEKTNSVAAGIWGEEADTTTATQLMDYGSLEEIKQLISGNTSTTKKTTTSSSITGAVCSDSNTGLLLASSNNDVSNNMSSSSWYYFDENKTTTGEGVVLTYY